MLRQSLVALLMLVLCITFVAAETIKGKITKLDDKTVTVSTKADKDGKTYDLAKDCKFFKMSKDAKEEVKAGDLKIGTKGAAGSITTDTANKVTEIVIIGKKK